ncbi:MAG TPA: acylphosphatase [Sphingomicrobium sp.]|nr:acylphosphatase [Sphingomicrobium sp.]
MTIARRVSVTGRVQGVFFRAWTCQQARELDLRGWVWNADDGSVEAHVEGDEGAVRQLVERMRQGPSGARVDELTVDVADELRLSGFEIRH